MGTEEILVFGLLRCIIFCGFKLGTKCLAFYHHYLTVNHAALANLNLIASSSGGLHARSSSIWSTHSSSARTTRRSNFPVVASLRTIPSAFWTGKAGL